MTTDNNNNNNEPPPHDSIPPHNDEGQSNGNDIRTDDIDVVDNTAPNLSEMYVAGEFASRHTDTLRYVAPWKKWLIWNGKFWEDDDKRQAHDMADQLCREMARAAGKRALTVASAGFRTSVLSLASDDQQLAATVSSWDRDPWLLNTPNGVVNLRTGVMRKAKPDDYMRMITSIGPKITRNDGDNCPRWLAFLNQIFSDDPGLVSYVQKICGYSLTGSIQEHQMWFGYGSGNNGKGVFIEVLATLMGDYHTNTPIETFTVQQFENHPTELARLQGKRLVTSSETEEGRRWAEARIKEITGGGKITARFMRQDFFDFLPQFKIFLTGNHMPVLRNVGLAMARRFNRVPFTVTIPPSQVNKSLARELIDEEGPGILLWMIQGCVEWQRSGIDQPSAVKEATASYFSSQDLLGEWMNDCCEKDSNGWVGTTELFNSWKMWTEARQEFTGSVRGFSMKLEDRGLMKKRNKEKTLNGFAGWKIKVYTATNGSGHAYSGANDGADLPF
jgi:putative DNA primase/helicase